MRPACPRPPPPTPDRSGPGRSMTGVRRRDVLELAMLATRVGLLDFQWEVLCPLCRGASDRHTRRGRGDGRYKRLADRRRGV